ncbi:MULTISPECIES: ribonuclease HI [unclassified Nitratiruptor]|uniref:ribonuclease HI n=1 Tax=unclassified Nitratiruptor TaxID=2624044 RepID=UPI001915D160|nr:MULTISPECIES: ribonuclease HI [unclassified Nitratiruptor]BCD59473.1 ribonuclease HI [Nitratiruptor sp. YY08-10]BCD63397.1 ribonuclease HI [Nitratiruptor sp. YY08-14]
MKKVSLFSDGSSLGNPGPGGYCAILRYKDNEKIIKGGEPHTTNNRMELKAVIEGLKALKEPCVVTVYSDSNYVVQAINSWLSGWIKKDFKNVKNPDLWKEFIEVAKPHRIKAVWVKGHSGHEENERCDEIAKEMAKEAGIG